MINERSPGLVLLGAATHNASVLVIPRFAATAFVLLATLVFGPLANGQSIALTFDDGPNMADTVGLSPADRNAAILSQLADAGLKSILFVTRTDADPQRNDLIREWGAEGHQIGNHTATHPDFDEVTLADYEQELLTCDEAIRAMPGFTRRFRFPYLKEGNTVEKRDGFRAFLDANSYKAGPVSVDASDWYYSQRLTARLKDHPTADTLPYRDAYLLFKAEGWKLIDSEVAFKDPLYEMRPNTLPAGESILWALAKQHGLPNLRYPGEDDTYEKPLLDRLHL